MKVIHGSTSNFVMHFQLKSDCDCIGTRFPAYCLERPSSSSTRTEAYFDECNLKC